MARDAVTGVCAAGFASTGLPAASAALTACGVVEVLYTETASGMPSAFHDSSTEFGHLIEIYERTERLGRFSDMVRDASVGWAGNDAIRRL